MRPDFIWFAALTAGLAACGDNAKPAATTTSTTSDTADATTADAEVTDATVSPDATEVVTTLAPNISEVLASECPVVPNKLRISTPGGNALVKLTLDAPRARCNDGSPAVAYVRAATDAARSKRWIFHLQAGGSCTSHDDCRDRWCGDQGVYDASKMSSRWAKPAIGDDGIFKREAGNPPGQWNQVYVYYCTSDSWVGQAEFELPSSTAAGSAPAYSLHARGHGILVALFEALERGGLQSDDKSVTLPKLGDAEDILWTGASAGSTGASHNLDWVAARYPTARVAGVFDAGLSVNTDGLDAAIATATEDHLKAAQSDFAEPAQAFYDASCLAAHPTEHWRCADTNELKRNYITTPFFQRLDLRDPTGSKGIISLGATLPEWSTAARATLVALSGIKDTAAEKTAIKRAPGVYGPSCTQHIASTDDDWYNGATVTDANGGEQTFRAALLAWLGGADVAIIDTVPASRSTCATPTDAQ